MCEKSEGLKDRSGGVLVSLLIHVCGALPLCVATSGTNGMRWRPVHENTHRTTHTTARWTISVTVPLNNNFPYRLTPAPAPSSYVPPGCEYLEWAIWRRETVILVEVPVGCVVAFSTITPTRLQES